MKLGAIFRGWRGFVLAGVVFVLLVWSDAWLKAGSHLGFKPLEADWVLESRDFPAFWAGIERGPVFDALRQELSEPLHRFELVAHEATGMRPTSYRWEAWLGSSALMASVGDHTGVSLRPGLLLRVASAFHRLFPGTEVDEGIHAYRGFHYAWRDGYLIASPSLGYVREALETSPVRLPPSQESPHLVWRSEADPNPFHFVIAAQRDLPLEGWIQVEIESRDRPLEQHHAAAEPMAVLTATRWGDIAAFVRAFAPNPEERPWAAPLQRALADTVSQWRLGELEDGWDETLGQTTFVLSDIERYGLIPMPHAAFIGEEYQRRAPAHPLEPLFAGGFTPIPYQWGPAEGTMYPLWGSALSPCLARSGPYWLAASRERLMPDLVEHVSGDTYTEADLGLWLNWGPTGDALADLLPEWGGHGLIPGADEGDVQRDYVPYANALARLGGLRITGRMHDGRLQLQGQLIGEPDMAEPQEDNPDS